MGILKKIGRDLGFVETRRRTKKKKAAKRKKRTARRNKNGRFKKR